MLDRPFAGSLSSSHAMPASSAADLIGLSVTNLEGVALGEVSHFVETPGGDVMIVRSEGGSEHWVPATKEHLSKVDLAAGQVVVDWPAALE